MNFSNSGRTSDSVGRSICYTRPIRDKWLIHYANLNQRNDGGAAAARHRAAGIARAAPSIDQRKWLRKHQSIIPVLGRRATRAKFLRRPLNSRSPRNPRNDGRRTAAGGGNLRHRSAIATASATQEQQLDIPRAPSRRSPNPGARGGYVSPDLTRVLHARETLGNSVRVTRPGAETRGRGTLMSASWTTTSVRRLEEVPRLLSIRSRGWLASPMGHFY